MRIAREYRVLLGVYGTLLVLLGATMAAASLGLGALGAGISLGIAVMKAALIYWFFMQLREQGGVARLFAAAAVFWILLLFALSTADFVTRTTIDGASDFAEAGGRRGAPRASELPFVDETANAES